MQQEVKTAHFNSNSAKSCLIFSKKLFNVKHQALFLCQWIKDFSSGVCLDYLYIDTICLFKSKIVEILGVSIGNKLEETDEKWRIGIHSKNIFLKHNTPFKLTPNLGANGKVGLMLQRSLAVTGCRKATETL